MIDAHGKDEVLFQELAVALGYKQNKLPFTLIAQRISLRGLRADLPRAEAILFGLAGFLNAPDLGVYESETRSYVRGLWDQWWPQRDEMYRLVLPPETWRLSGARPLNHPQRRLAALAEIARAWPRWMDSLGASTPLRGARDFLLDLKHSYWNHHYTLTSEAAGTEMAIVGESRVAEILANVVIPYLHAGGREVWVDYSKLPARLTNRRLETAVARLFSDDPRRRQFTRTVSHQQGLLQIYEDFCLQDNSDCAHCPFPEQMRTWV